MIDYQLRSVVCICNLITFTPSPLLQYTDQSLITLEEPQAAVGSAIVAAARSQLYEAGTFICSNTADLINLSQIRSVLSARFKIKSASWDRRLSFSVNKAHSGRSDCGSIRQYKNNHTGRGAGLTPGQVTSLYLFLHRDDVLIEGRRRPLH